MRARHPLTCPWLAVAGVAVLGQLAGCGGDSGSCGAIEPCGGEVVGNWTVVTSCLQGTFAEPVIETGCEQTFSGTRALRMEGTVTFNADLTYLSESTLFESASVLINPSPCFLPTTCPEISQQTQLSASQPDSPIATASCAASGKQCRCSITFRPLAVTQQGTYSATGNTLSMTEIGQASSSSDYCVANDQLRVESRVSLPDWFNPAFEVQFRGTLDLGRR